jgi:predicted transcriptional regulator
MADIEKTDLTTLTVDLLSAYFANNTVDSSALAGLISSTHEALKKIEEGPSEVAPEPEHKPAVGIRKSLGSPDHIISMIDGKPYKMLKRHLSTNGLTPAEYRQRYNLPSDYPMVAPSYADARRAVAAKIGLGSKATRKSAAPVASETAAPAAEPAAATPKTPRAKTAAKSAPKPAAPRKARAPKAAATPVEAVPNMTADVPTEVPAVKAASKPASPKRTPRKAPATAAPEPTEG